MTSHFVFTVGGDRRWVAAVGGLHKGFVREDEGFHAGAVTKRENRSKPVNRRKGQID
jgi:hypothetical protein